MKVELFDKIEPSFGEYCKVVYLHKGRKFEGKYFYKGRNHDTLTFLSGNWANDFLILKVNRLMYIKPVINQQENIHCPNCGCPKTKSTHDGRWCDLCDNEFNDKK